MHGIQPTLFFYWTSAIKTSMAPFKSTDRLTTLLLAYLVQRLNKVLSQKLKPTEITRLEAYLIENLSLATAQSLVQQSLMETSLDPKIQLKIANLLLQPTHSDLHFSFLCANYYPEVVRLLEKKGSGLRKLSLRGVWLKAAERRAFTKVLEGMSRLSVLSVQYIANDELLAVLSKNCPTLRWLDVSGSAEVTPKGLKNLQEAKSCCSLEFVGLGCQGCDPLPIKAVADLLENLPNLQSIGAYPFMGGVVQLMRKKQQSGSAVMQIVTRIRHFHDRHTQESSIVAVCESTPKVESCYLDSPHVGTLEEIMNRRCWKELSFLKLSKCRAEELNRSLSVGSKLTSLELVSCRGTVNLCTVAEDSPTLVELQLFYCGGIYVPRKLTFPCMTRLWIYETPSRFTSATLLRSCPSVISLTLSDCEDLTDDLYSEILCDNPLRSCDEIWLLHAPLLTATTLDLMVEKMENVRSIGALDKWDLDDSDCIRLIKRIKNENLDLTLWRHFSFQFKY